MDLIIKNALLPHDEKSIDIGVDNGKIAAIAPQLAADGRQTIDAEQRLVSPSFVDPHLHLDAVLTLGQPTYNISGSHPEGIKVWGEYKKAYPNFEDMAERVRRAVSWATVSATSCQRGGPSTSSFTVPPPHPSSMVPHSRAPITLFITLVSRV